MVGCQTKRQKGKYTEFNEELEYSTVLHNRWKGGEGNTVSNNNLTTCFIGAGYYEAGWKMIAPHGASDL